MNNFSHPSAVFAQAGVLHGLTQMSIFSIFLTYFMFASLAAQNPAPVIRVEFDGCVTPTSGEFGIKGDAVAYVEGKQGQAAAMGDTEISYIPSDMITPEEGSMTIWIKPLNWKWSDSEFIFFLSSMNVAKQGGRMIFYKYKNPEYKKQGLGLVCWYGKPGKHGTDHIYANYTEIDKLPADQWTQLGMVWSKTHKLLSLYINGTPVASGRIGDEMFFEKITEVTVNQAPFHPRNRDHRTAYDMLRIYDTALTEAQMMALYKEESSSQPHIPFAMVGKTTFNIPFMTSPPKIDGNFEDLEWINAARLSGFVNINNPELQTNVPTDVYAGCDNENFYFCFISKIPDATTLVHNVTERDGAVYLDDAIEIFLSPEKQVGYYQGIFNLNAAIYDAFSGNTNWNGAWKVKSGIYEGLWTTEIAIPFADMKASFRDQAVWGFNFCRDWQIDGDILFSSVSPTVTPFASRSGDMRLVDDACYPRFALDYEKLFQRSFEFRLEVKNPSIKTQEITLSIEIRDTAGTIHSQRQMTASIDAGASHFFDFSDPLPGIRAAVASLIARDNHGTVIFRQDVPLLFKDEIAVSMNTELETNTLTAKVDLNSHYAIKEAVKIEGKLVSDDGSQSLAAIFSGAPVSKHDFDLAGLEPGGYQLQLSFSDANGNTIFNYSEPYMHIGQPRWLTERPGSDMGVVWPYTPIKASGNVFSMIGRDHIFGTGLLPEQVVSQGIKLFAKAPTLKVRINGENHKVDNFSFQQVKIADDECVMNFTASIDELTVTGTIHMEFDGFFWYDMTVSARNNPVELDGLTLSMEFPAEIAQFITAHFFKRENVTGKLVLPEKLKRFPSVWTGNLDVGFTFFLESFENWRNHNDEEVYSFEESPDGNVVWDIRFIDRATALSTKGLRYEFGVQANPVKPIPDNFRSWRVYFMENYNISHPWQINRKIKKYPGHGGFFTPLHTSMEDFRAETKRFRDVGAELSLYLNPLLVSTDATEYKIFRAEWRNPYNAYPQCPNSSFTDFIVWQIDDLIKHGDLKVVYVDSLGAVTCHNPLHGCGYFDENGQAALTYPIRGIRNYMKRLYSLLHAPEHDHDVYKIWAHMSARTSAPINAWVDFQASGEEQEYRMTREFDYLELYPLDEFQVYFMKSSGVVPMFLPNLGRTGPKENRYKAHYNDQFLLLVLLHDALLWNNWSDVRYVNRLYGQLDAFGYKDEALEFFNYRKQKMVTCAEPDIHISVYRLSHAGRAFAVIGNWQQKKRTIKVDIDKKSLDLGADLKYSDLRTGASINPEKIEIAPYNFVLLKIEAP